MHVAIGQNFMNLADAQALGTVETVAMGSSVGFHDFDNDGWDDLTIAAPGDSVHLYRNVSGQLVKLPSPIATPGNTKHVLWADIDNDGQDDLLVTRFNGPIALYRSLGGLTFEDISATCGIPETFVQRSGATFGDYDRDGFLDLYVTTYFPGGPETYEQLNHLYRNNGDGTFTDVTLQAGVGDGHKASFQAVWMDHDMDGWPDLYVINDRLPQNTLFRNNGDGTFTDITQDVACGCPNTDSMSLALGDPDNDGLLDIFVTNNGTNALPDRPCRLLKRQQGGAYVDQAAEYGVDCAYFGWGAVWADIDNNAWQDLFVTSEGTTGNQVHMNFGIIPLLNTSWGLFDNPPITTFTAARGDLNNDGFPDFVVGSAFPHPPQLWVGSGGGGFNHVRVTVRGTASNRMGVGTWIRVCTDGACQVRYTTCGENYLGQDSQQQHVGLRNAATIDSVLVTYVSGHTDRYYGLAANTHYWFTEGETYQAQVIALGPTTFCSGNSVVLDAGDHFAYAWNTGYTGRYLEVSASGTYAVTIITEHGVQVGGGSVEVSVLPSPAILPAVEQPTCAGYDNGSIALGNSTGSPASVVWNTGANGASLTGLAAGTYTYTYTDLNGCTASGSVLLIEPPELVVLVESSPALLGGDGTITLLPFGGVPPYTFSLDGAPVVNPITGLNGGLYTVAVTDANGCVFTEAVTVGGPTSTEASGIATLRTWPNPADDRLHLTGSTAFIRIELRESSGRTVRSWTTAHGGLDLSGLMAGYFTLAAVDTEGKTYMGRIIKGR
jgi:hypothetical protein